MHAHKACAQFLTCTSGAVEVDCSDGNQSANFELKHPNVGLYIPPGIWAEQRYKSKDAALTVLCDRPYEAEDYIREFPAYLTYREELVARSTFGRKDA
jgi:dTDP-4-dehydrorhamnose 3,5-epimerase-like enzyme